MGKAALISEIMDRKWAFKVWVACLAALQQWTSGVPSWNSTFQSSSIMRQNSLLASFFQHLVFNGLDTVIEAVNDVVVGIDVVVVVIGL